MSGKPGYWCKKLQDWFDAQEEESKIFFDLAPGDHDIEELAKEAYKILSGQRESVPLTEPL